MDYRALGKNIRKYRLLNGICQEDLAERCNCSVSHIAHIEKGLGKPSLEMVVIIANKLGVTVDQLLSTYYKNPEVVYLREIAERIDNTMSHSASSCVKASAVTWTQWNALQRSKTEKHMIRRTN